MKEIKHILFIVNPISGDKNKENLIHLVGNELKVKKIELTLYETKGEGDEKEIQNILNENTIVRVFVAGGDGTIKMVADAILDQNIPLAIFPAGSADGFALNFDIPPTIEEQLKVGLKNNIFRIDLVKIDEHISLYLADFGVNAELIQNYDNALWRGKIGYLMQTIPTLVNSKHPYQFEITAGNKKMQVEASLLSIANCRKYGTGACINPNGVMDDGKFEIIVFKSLNLIEIVKTFTNQSELDSDFADTYSVSSATISCEIPVPFQIDGEYLGELTEVEISILKKALQFCVPENYLIHG